MLTVRVLGAFEAARDGRAVDLGGPRQRSVLALLLVAAESVPDLETLTAEHPLREDVEPCRRIGAPRCERTAADRLAADEVALPRARSAADPEPARS